MNTKSRNNYHILFFLSLMLSFCSAIGATSDKNDINRQSKSLAAPPKTATVSRILDGDTFVLSDGTHVRLLGIDTPEKGEPFADIAKGFSDSALGGRDVRLEYEKEPLDKYGRLLAYVYINSNFINELLIRRGLARVYIFSKNERFNGRFISAQKDARKARAGIWSLPAPPSEPYYIAPGGSFRFHRPLCTLIKNANMKKARKIKTRDEALDLGLSPCRECRP
jgi:micrococcal nuclease